MTEKLLMKPYAQQTPPTNLVYSNITNTLYRNI